MSVIRLSCEICGLEATCVKTGLGCVTSVDPNVFARTCPFVDAANRGELPPALELACTHLAALGAAADDGAGTERVAV